MNSATAIAILDRQISAIGEMVKLHRTTGTTNSATFSADVLAIVRPFGSKEIIGSISQGDFNVAISPSRLIAAHWPGEQVSPVIGDAIVPRTTDRITISGKSRQIVSVSPRYVSGAIVRIDIQVRG